VSFEIISRGNAIFVSIYKFFVVDTSNRLQSTVY